MSVQLNHTVVYVRDKNESAAFVAEILGLGKPTSMYSFTIVTAANGVSLDFLSTSNTLSPQHYAFLITEEEFDLVFERIVKKNITFWADHAKGGEGQINRNDGGRGFYFEEPSGHWLEVLTRPYGSGR
jgi:catechol 2,3-dioxygenase-like lactoylglutathione lyase family enzyme